MLKALLVIAIVATLPGCATVQEQFENSISMTLAGDRLLINSMYGPFGITSKVRDADRDALLKIMSK